MTEATWRRFFDPIEPLHALVAERDGKLIGLTHYLLHRSTWAPVCYCYLEDLFVEPSARGGGTGRALIAAVEAAARAAGASRLYWLTHETNETAQTLYNKVAERAGFIQYRKKCSERHSGGAQHEPQMRNRASGIRRLRTIPE